jgi:gas vesicle protein
MANDNKGKTLIGGILAGAVAGAALGLLFAPKVGRETRDLVQRKSRDYTNTVREKIRRRGNSAGENE